MRKVKPVWLVPCVICGKDADVTSSYVHSGLDGKPIHEKCVTTLSDNSEEEYLEDEEVVQDDIEVIGRAGEEPIKRRK